MLIGVRKYINDCLLSVSSRIKENIESHGRTASGQTAASLQIEETNTGGVLVGSGSFLSLQRGRKGGRVPKNFSDIIRQWIIDKGISVQPKPAKRSSKYSDEERAIMSMSRAIAFSIMKNGTLLYKQGGYDDIYDTVIKEELEKLRPKVVGVFALAVRDINQNIAEYENRNNNK